MKILSIAHDGESDRQLLLRSRLHIGSAPYNGLVLADPAIEGSHAVVRVAGDHLLIEDLGTSSGTWVNGHRIAEPTELTGTARIGGFQLTARDEPAPAEHALFLEEIATGIRHRLQDGSFLVGHAPSADILVPGGTPRGLRIQGLQVELDDSPLTLPWRGTLGGIEAAVFHEAPCEHDVDGRLVVEVGLHPPEARVYDPSTEGLHTVRAPNRVALLYCLANAHLEDVAAGVEDAQVGWRSDEDVAVAVWGRDGRNSSRNRLNTLTYRLRTELSTNGVEQPILEKMAGWMRLEPVALNLG